ncbi:TonB-dependent receptor [Agrobacterium sp. OT33]|uniref:TonB-dependent receptor n=1 Tax=Agrobacterium sp. OT33 TaxID=2815338 RepID=UPI001A9030D9|nr:TonB-dependent receptor [Agrobacterium sp. OT33]MBO0128371.1 TonB-dependent hemoglobin/transferrin/lactoferrin family receptor [Agrobacterium sp. OT33]
MAFGVEKNKIARGRRTARNIVLWSSTALAIGYGTTNVTAQTTPTTERVSSQSAVRSFNIPAQPLLSALSTFNRQAGIQVTQASGAAARNVAVNAVRGNMSPEQALAQMLSGTGVTYKFTGNRAAVIGARQSVNGAAGSDESTVLAPIIITSNRARNSGSGFQGTPDWVYEQPSSVSVISREAIQNAPVRNTRDLLDNVAGVYANRSEAQNPGIAVNIRGLQDQNRVVTMIDGARQNFQRSGHGATQRTYVDTAFIREIDVEKSGTSSVGGAGALGGSVNFRTVGADDIITGDKKWGVEVNAGTGTNEFTFDGSGIAAFRLSDSFSVLGGVARKKVGEYDIGKNGELTLNDLTVEDGAVISTGQEVLATILKAEAEFTDDLNGSLAWIRNDSEFSHGSYDTDGLVLTENTQDVLNNTITANLNWDPDSDLINLNARLWYNHTRNKEVRGASTVTNYLDWPVNYSLGTVGVSLDNTSTVDTALGALSFNYGVEAFWDRGKTEADTFYASDGTDLTASFTGSTPSGNRDVYSAFANATLEHDDWLVVSGGLRYDYYKLHGNTSVFGLENVTRQVYGCTRYRFGTCVAWGNVDQLVTVYPETVLNVDNSQGEFLPTAMVAVKPYDWLQPFVKYSRSMRPPSIMETFFTGGHPGATVVQYAPNPDLMAEVGDTFEIGANITQNGLFSADDSFRFKAVGFYRQIDNYISMGTVVRPETGREHTAYVNVDGTTRMKGIELEANYDAGPWYAGISYTHLKTDFGDSYTYAGTTYEVSPSVIFVPPRNKITVDAGVRVFEEKLVLGGRISHVGGTSPNIGLLTSSYVSEDYTLYDLYGSYAFNENTKLRVAVTNLTDVAYVPALGTTSYPGPGRTVTASLNFKF